MARKKSIKKSAQAFVTAAMEIDQFLQRTTNGASDEDSSRLHNYAIIWLYREFESFVLDCLVGAMNQDSSTVSSTVGVQFPKHLATPVCEFLITGGGYFDFKGRSGLIKTLKDNIPENHYLVTVVSDATYTNALERLSALRNFAAHESDQSRSAALKAIGASNLTSSGSWLRVNKRFKKISGDLTALANAVEAAAPL